MRRAQLAPRTHIFVCQNRRPTDSPLGPGCGEAGDAVFSILKREVAQARAYADVWITQTACQGVCPAHGTTVSIYGAETQPQIVTEVEAGDALELYSAATSDRIEQAGLDRMLAEMEELQRTKVVALARRLKPGLTAEDIRNPHDFPELLDPDWHYEDGVLTGIQSVVSAVRATRRQ